MSRITLFAHGILAVVLAANSSPVFGAADKGHDDDGGASIVRNGLVLTFGDVRIPLHVPNGPGGLYDIPGLQEATQGVQNLPLGLQSLGGQLLTALHPTETILNARQYFTIDEADISSSTIYTNAQYNFPTDVLNGLIQKHPRSLFLAFLSLNSGNLSLDLSPPMKDSERIETYSSPMDDGERSQCIDAGGVVGQDVDDCLYSSSEEPKSADVNSLDGNVLHSSTPLWISLKDPTPSDFLQLSLSQTLNNVQCFASRHNTRNQKDPLCPSGLIQANSSSTIAQENFTLQWGGYDGNVTLIDENIVESVLH